MSKKQHHYYLNKLGVKSTECCVFNTTEHDKERSKRFKKERNKYGFDSRETWSMDFTLYTWLYEHLKWYLNNAPIDMTFYQIDIPEWNAKKKRACKHRTVKVTQEEAISIICDNLEFAILEENLWNENEIEAQNRSYYAMRILAEVLPLLWW